MTAVPYTPSKPVTAVPVRHHMVPHSSGQHDCLHGFQVAGKSTSFEKATKLWKNVRELFGGKKLRGGKTLNRERSGG